MNIAGKCIVLAVCTLLYSLTSCTADFSRFQFGQKKPTRPRDAGAQNVSDATGSDTEPDAGVGEPTSQ
jgi:hypothetical protein